MENYMVHIQEDYPDGSYDRDQVPLEEFIVERLRGNISNDNGRAEVSVLQEEIGNLKALTTGLIVLMLGNKTLSKKEVLKITSTYRDSGKSLQIKKVK